MKYGGLTDRLPAPQSMSNPPHFHDLSAVVHVHSTYSDGTADLPELLGAARETGVEALLLTDHDTLGARHDGWEGHHDGVFLLVGEEITLPRGHYLSFGTPDKIAQEGREALEIADAVRAAGGVGFAAHPFSRGGRMLVPALARRIALPQGWPALEDPAGCDGIEVWSLTTDAAESWRSPLAALRGIREQERMTAAGPPADHLARWDRLAARRRVPGVAGLDGHQPGPRIGGRIRSPFPHPRTFAQLRTHLLCERPLGCDLDTDRATILTALREGRAWLASPLAAPPEGARAWFEGDGPAASIGEEARAAPGVLRVRLPRRAEVTVRRDGTPLLAGDFDSVDLDVEAPGAYRVEAWIDGRFWLCSNPIYLR